MIKKKVYGKNFKKRGRFELYFIKDVTNVWGNYAGITDERIDILRH